MSLGWTAYVAPKPPKEGSKTQSVRLPYKSGLLSKKVCYNVSLRENFQRQSCKAFTGLSICAQMVGGGCRFLPKILGQIDQPPWKTPSSIFARIASTISLHWEKNKLNYITNRKITTGFLMDLRWTAYVASKPPPCSAVSAIAEFLVSFLAIRRFRPFLLVVLY